MEGKKRQNLLANGAPKTQPARWGCQVLPIGGLEALRWELSVPGVNLGHGAQKAFENRARCSSAHSTFTSTNPLQRTFVPMEKPSNEPSWLPWMATVCALIKRKRKEAQEPGATSCALRVSPPRQTSRAAKVGSQTLQLLLPPRPRDRRPKAKRTAQERW